MEPGITGDTGFVESMVRAGALQYDAGGFFGGEGDLGGDGGVADGATATGLFEEGALEEGVVGVRRWLCILGR